jgi:GNAT superfamily N-acetyltransferase
MINIIKNFFSGFLFFTGRHRERLEIKNFIEIRYVSSEMPYENDIFVNNKPGGIMLEYYNKDIKIGYIRYYVNSGQIGLFFIQEEYQNRGLGKQILSKVIKELQDNNCNEIWAVTSKDHIFWSNVYNKSFSYRDPAHSSVGGDGYYIDLSSFNPDGYTQLNQTN